MVSDGDVVGRVRYLHRRVPYRGVEVCEECCRVEVRVVHDLTQCRVFGPDFVMPVSVVECCLWPCKTVRVLDGEAVDD